jgi:hypothetical protein
MAITLTITSGASQLVPANRGLGSKPIVINVQNAGVNVAGATVAITAVLAGSGSITPPLTSAAPVTDANGNATVQFVPGTQVAGTQQVMEYDFTATYSGATATFTEIGFYMSPQNIFGASGSRILPAPSALTPYVVSAAGAAGTPIKINVYRTDTLAGIPNVGCRIIPINDGTGGTQQTITSAEGSGPENLALTDASGNVTMTPTFAVASSAMSPVPQTFIVDFGKFYYFGPFSYTVGAPVTPVPQPTTVLPAGSTVGSPFSGQRPTAIDIDQIESRVRQGAAGQLLTADGTGQAGNLPQYATDRSATDSGVPAASAAEPVPGRCGRCGSRSASSPSDSWFPVASRTRRRTTGCRCSATGSRSPSAGWPRPASGSEAFRCRWRQPP